MSNNSEADLRTEMSRLGAREFEVVALLADPARGLAALAYAEQRGAERPIAYATSMYENPDWQPSGEARRRGTNLSVERECTHCGGHRMVPVIDSVDELYGDAWAPCVMCNKGANTDFWRTDGTKFASTPR